ncbi:2Fe-2S iron-sulfur cluster-binding protein [uncultured Paracoccus sp.]|uniref:2Fe-2S iron-sulfur cluster-binding protein n=1 Tax=uncultured Paracoccus sp. TaxID=189685 RepID=UPI0025D9E4C0|nr:2Fe-2S iron-sulfur cluster-binding protein [uncultured Paracoccus sp.]
MLHGESSATTPFQCSFCTPGFVMAATALVEELGRAPIPRAQLEDRIVAALNENICRCTGYIRYLEAVRAVILATPGLVIDVVATDARQG